MANILTAYVRFFPKKKKRLPHKLIDWIIEDITEDLRGWAIIWNIPEDESHFDLIFTYKRSLDYDIFKSQDVLNAFHIWVRISDSGSFLDLITLKSNSFAPLNTRLQYVIWDENWNYLNHCLYCADRLSIHLLRNESESLYSFP